MVPRAYQKTLAGYALVRCNVRCEGTSNTYYTVFSYRWKLSGDTAAFTNFSISRVDALILIRTHVLWLIASNCS